METSFLHLLLLCPAVLLYVQGSSFPFEPQCHFPDFLQTERSKQWKMTHSNKLTTFDVEGGKIFARSGTCVRPRGHHSRRHSGAADCVKSNYTRVCLEERPGNKYLTRHIESNFGSKFLCMEFLRRGISVVQVKLSLIEGPDRVDRLCDDSSMDVDPWPWISGEHLHSPPVPCPVRGGYNLLLNYSSPPPAGRYRSYGSSYYGPPVFTGDGDAYECTDSSVPPVRMESDCLVREGVEFRFKHQSCLPSGTRLALRQRAQCMATWRDGPELFTMLRAEGQDDTFFCLRLTPHHTKDDHLSLSLNLQDARGGDDDGFYYSESRPQQMKLGNRVELDEVVLFVGWVCPTSAFTEAARRFYPGSNELSPYMAFSVRDHQIITEACSDELTTCHNLTTFCKHLHCMKTCGQCQSVHHLPGESADAVSSLSSSSSSMSQHKMVDMSPDRFSAPYSYAADDPKAAGGEKKEMVDGEPPLREDNSEQPPLPTKQPSFQQKCSFPEGMRGTWLQRYEDGHDEKLVITASSFDHPRLGRFECVTFTAPGAAATPLRRVLWSAHDNGCYPSFTCLHYSTPSKSVMRYRLAGIQHWPLELSDDSICDEKHFLEPPDRLRPAEKYPMRGWEVVRRVGHIHSVACILPHYLPKVVSLVDDRGRSGCLVHGTYTSPRAIILYFHPQKSPEPGKSKSPNRAHNRDVSGKSDDVGHKYDVYGGGRVDKFDEGVQPEQHPEPMEKSYREKVNAPGDYPNKVIKVSNDWSHDLYQMQDAHYVEPDSEASPEWSEKSRGLYSSGHFPPPAPSPSSHDQGGTEVHIKHGARPAPKGPEKSHQTHHHAKSVNGDQNHQYNPDDIYYSSGGGYGGKASSPGHYPAQHKTYNPYYKRQYRFRRSSSQGDGRSGEQTSYDCLAVMTYVDSYKSLLTVTSDNRKEILCWFVVNETTVVILKASSCNSLTAQRVLGDPTHNANHLVHVHRILHLQEGKHDCEALFPTDPVRPELGEFREDNTGGSTTSVLSSTLMVAMLVLLASLCHLLR